MSAGLMPFYADLDEDLNTSFPKGRYLILAVQTAPIGGHQIFVASHKDSDGKIYEVPAKDMKFRGFAGSCLMCQWPRVDVEKV